MSKNTRDDTLGQTGSQITSKVELKADSKQITFKVNKSSVLIWRRILLLRYFNKLGESVEANVSWSDYDNKCKRIVLHDDKKPFKSVIPAPNLCKSTTQISIKGKKLITFTLYYTTYNCLVQGHVTKQWVESEFKLLSEKVLEIMKKGRDNPDKVINEMPLLIPINNDIRTDMEEDNNHIDNVEEHNEENETFITVENIDDDSQDQTVVKELQNEHETPKSINKNIMKEHVVESKNERKSSLSDLELIQALHTIENDHVDQSLSLQNDVKSVLTTLQTLNDKIEKLDKTIQTLNNAEVIERLSALELKVDELMSKSKSENQNSVQEIKALIQQDISDNKPDCVKFIDNIVELTNKISGLELKFETFENKSFKHEEARFHDMDDIPTQNRNQPLNKEKEKIEINVKTSNRFDALLADLMEDNETEEYDLTSKEKDKRKAIVITTGLVNENIQTPNKEIGSDEKNVQRINESSNVDSINDSMRDSNEMFTDVGKTELNEEVDLWIIGSSITRNINPQLMYKNKTVRVTTLLDKTVNGAKNYILTGKVKAKIILFQIGSNDLNKKSPNEVLHEIEDLVNTCQSQIPGAEIIMSEILPRFQQNENWRYTYESKRSEFNSGLRQISIQYNCNISKCPYVQENDVVDGIHLTIESGVPKLISTYKIVTNKLLGMKDPRDGNMRKDRYHKSRFNYRSSTFNSYKPEIQQYNRRSKYDDFYEQDKHNLNYDKNRSYNNELRSMPDTQWSRVSRYGDQDSYNCMNSSDIYENKHMDRFQGYENKSGNNFDETAQEKLKWFLKSFIQELN